MQSIPLRFVQKKVSGHGARSVVASLSLTSMIDFLVVTVVFLLMTFSASGETPIAKGLTLPEAENTLDMVDAPIVAVAGSAVIVDGSQAGSTRSLEGSNQLGRIDELYNILKNKRELWKQLHPGKKLPGRGGTSNRPGCERGHCQERVSNVGAGRLPQRKLHGQRAAQIQLGSSL